MFDLLAATNARERVDELEKFIEFWYGPRQTRYGETEERLNAVSLPYPLRRFYAFAGRWPSPIPGGEESAFFYTGASGHHLHDLDSLKVRADGSLNFFMEYQGDWEGFTASEGDDPPVWIEGQWDDEENEDAGEDSKLVADSLPVFWSPIV